MFLHGIIAAQAKLHTSSGPVTPTFTTYPYTGTENIVVVPSGMNYARIQTWGGGGSGGHYMVGSVVYGGNGGYSDIVIAVTSGDVLTIQTAQGGRYNGFAQVNPGGWPDGAQGSFGDATGGGGGGSSRVFLGSSLVVLAAGGGAGGGYTGGGHAGDGGGAMGGNSGHSDGGKGGTQSAGGLGGTLSGGAGTGPTTYATRNTQRGGNGGPTGSTTGDGGGGGGGYYGGGGGGGDGRGAGGGSGYITPSALASQTVNGGTAGANLPTEDNYPGAPIAKGSTSATPTHGGNGFVCIELSPVPF